MISKKEGEYGGCPPEVQNFFFNVDTNRANLDLSGPIYWRGGTLVDYCKISKIKLLLEPQHMCNYLQGELSHRARNLSPIFQIGLGAGGLFEYDF